MSIFWAVSSSLGLVLLLTYSMEFSYLIKYSPLAWKFCDIWSRSTLWSSRKWRLWMAWWEILCRVAKMQRQKIPSLQDTFSSNQIPCHSLADPCSYSNMLWIHRANFSVKNHQVYCSHRLNPVWRNGPDPRFWFFKGGSHHHQHSGYFGQCMIGNNFFLIPF